MHKKTNTLKTIKKIILITFFIISIGLLNSCTNNNLKKENMEKSEKIKKIEKKQIIENLSVEDFEKEMKNPETILIDIRTAPEWKMHGIISKNQEYIIYDNNEKFAKQISKLDKNKKYLIYCFHGNRTREALKVMKKSGFIYVKDLAGGIDAWKLKEKKVEKY